MFFMGTDQFIKSPWNQDIFKLLVHAIFLNEFVLVIFN